MTIAMLMRNTLNLARHAASLPRLKLRMNRDAAEKDDQLANKVLRSSETFLSSQPRTKKRFLAVSTIIGFALGISVGILLSKKKLLPY